MEIEGLQYKAVATAGDVYLGGIDWDERLVIHLAEAFQLEHSVDLFGDPVARQMLLQKAAETKHSLSTRESVTVFVSYEGKRLKHEVTRATFEELTGDLLDRTMMTVNKLLRDTQIEFKDLTRLLLVGGSTRMPAVSKLLERETGLQADRSLSPDESVAHGAAIYAGLLMKTGAERINGMSVTNVSSHDLGILGVETETGRKRRSIMIPRNTQLPVKARKTFPTLRENQRSVEVNVIEGGDSSGNNSTPIAKCRVSDLPENLPAKTPVQVIFKYGSDGRLTVQASLPSIGKDAEMLIQRAAGLDEETIIRWTEMVDSGIPDSAVEVTPAAQAPAAPSPPEPQAAKPQPAATPATPPVIEAPVIQAPIPETITPPVIPEAAVAQPIVEQPVVVPPAVDELMADDSVAEESLAEESDGQDLMPDDPSPAAEPPAMNFFPPPELDEDGYEYEDEEEMQPSDFPQIDLTTPTVTEPDPPADPPPKKKGGWRTRAKKLSE